MGISYGFNTIYPMYEGSLNNNTNLNNGETNL